MPNGQCIKQDFTIISRTVVPETVPTSAFSLSECCFILPALASFDDNAKFKNDKHSVIWFFNELADASQTKLYLQKQIGGLYPDEITNFGYEITDDTIGTYNSLGTIDFGYENQTSPNFKNKYGERAIGLEIDWQKVLKDEGENGFGEGDYRILCKSGDLKQYSFEFCLLQWTAPRADETVVAEWWRNGSLGSRESDEKLEDYHIMNRYNRLRLPNAMFGLDTSTYESESVKYQSGKKVWLTDSHIEEYTLELFGLPYELHRFIEVDLLHGDTIQFTDFNINNPTKHVERKVIRTSNYEPKWVKGSSFAPVEVKFQQAIQNFTHNRS
jgi:hypothetical protein